MTWTKVRNKIIYQGESWVKLPYTNTLFLFIIIFYIDQQMHN